MRPVAGTDKSQCSGVRRCLGLALALLLAGAGGCVNGSLTDWPPIVPPPMPQRELVRPATLEGAERVLLEVRGLKLPLFLPEGWQTSTNAGQLAVHFHTADWVAWGEHHRAGYHFPLLSVFLGSGSAVYRAPFIDPAAFAEVLAAVEAELRRRNPGAAPINRLDFASFSAGYGAVRELVQQPGVFRRLERVVLSDSLYGGLDETALAGGRREVTAEHVGCWLPLAEAAMRGDKTFVLTLSQVPTTAYASTRECAEAILTRLKLTWTAACPELPASRDAQFPLLGRADAGRLHFWSYGGTNAAAHMTHPRHLADVWRALDWARE